MQKRFDHEKLRVYQTAIRFVAWCEPLLDEIPKTLAAHTQLDRCSTSIPLNIAEGNGKFTAPDRCRFFDTARGSALEAAACLDVLVAKRRLPESEVVDGKQMLHDVVSMLVGLIKNNSSGERVFEAESASYGSESGE